MLPNYTKFTEYVKKLDAESDRMIVQSIGKTAEGRDQLMAIITAPENHKNLAKYKDISRRLALAEGLTDDQARALARDGKAVVWIDGGLHATEVLGAQQLTETIYQLVSKNDRGDAALPARRDHPRRARQSRRHGAGLRLVHAQRGSRPSARPAALPRLYQKYIGHDNNRDFYMSAQNESININTQLYHEWFPQIIYNHHQTGPTGTILFAPPFRDPANYNYHPLIITGLDVVGSAMHNRFVAENKPGATMRRGANYSTWWNGGLRTSPYFHNMIGLLTESIGHPTPMEVAFVPDRQIASADLPFPIAAAEVALPPVDRLLDHRELGGARRRVAQSRDLPLQHLQDGQGQHRQGVERHLDDVSAAAAGDQGRDRASRRRWMPAIRGWSPAASRADTVPIAQYEKLAQKPEWRDPRGYILSANQPDFLTATKFVNALIKNGVTIHRATAPFSAGGKQYPAGSWVVKTAQAFRPHVLDMFEPQDHPNDFQFPGGPPIPPYDNAGWTLAYQMGVKFDRILDGFDGPFEKVTGLQKPAPGKVTEAAGAVGYVVPHHQNDAFIAVNRLLKANEEVFFVADRSYQSADGTGVIFITAKPTTSAVLDKAAADLGLNFTAVAAASGGRDAEADQAAHRPVGHVWRLDAVRLDALAARAVRVRLRARVPADARCRQPEVEIRRDHLPRRRHSRNRRRRWRLRRRTAAESGRPARGISAAISAASPSTRPFRS